MSSMQKESLYIKEAEELLDFIQNTPTPYHMVDTVARMLEEEGFEELSLQDLWMVNPGGAYYVKAHDSSIFAFRIGEKSDFGDPIRLVTAHTDTPGFRIKPKADVYEAPYEKLNVEVYGGPIVNTWLDRPLGIAGIVMLKGKDAMHPERRLIRFETPSVIIPNLAPHLNPAVNAGQELNKQIDMLPLIGLASKGEEKSLKTRIAERLSVPEEEILSYDLALVYPEKGYIYGDRKELLSSPRLDNATSCFGAVRALIEARREKGINCIALFDHEECGSTSKQGAGSVLFPYVLEKLFHTMNMDRSTLLTVMNRSFAVSTDVAHAVHPNHREKSDLNSECTMDTGVVLKLESNQRYTTSAEGTAMAKAVLVESNISWKEYANRSDIRGGSTLGSILSSYLPIPGVDLGIPVLAMHSTVETMATKSQYELKCFLKKVFEV